ncbi:hypothetical protein BDZ45DRAFT_686076 [Acephala macrosclerotiorum]|nr:hypothetical protein BDZ45DRAFT_686076 [Acephala macrosclerotiorum]
MSYIQSPSLGRIRPLQEQETSSLHDQYPQALQIMGQTTVDRQQVYSQLYQSLLNMDGDLPSESSDGMSTSSPTRGIASLTPVVVFHASPHINSPEEMKCFLAFLQKEGKKVGVKSPLSILQLLQALEKHPEFDWNMATFKYCFPGAFDVAVADPDGWSDLPALQFLADKYRSIRHESQSSAAASTLVPCGHTRYFQKVGKEAGYPSNELATPQCGGDPIQTQVQHSKAVILYRDFEPSRKAQGTERQVSPELARKAREAGLRPNPKYKSDLNEYHLRNASCLPHRNIPVFVKGIHVNTTVEEILAIVEEGKVFSSSRVPESLPRFPYAAANITFMSTRAANM